MAKLHGAEKAEFLRRMAAGRRKAAKGSPRKAAKGKRKGKGRKSSGMVAGRSIAPRKAAGSLGKGTVRTRVKALEAAVTTLARNDVAIATKVHQLDGRIGRVEGVLSRWAAGRGGK